jgi:DNA-binding NarL/FixJ family response regulator
MSKIENFSHLPIKVVICDDHQVVLEGLNMILSEESGFAVAGLFQTGLLLKQFLSTKTNLVDVVIIDAQLKQENGFEIAQQINGLGNFKMILFSSFVDSYMILRAKKVGFHACVSKDIQSLDLIQLLKSPMNEFLSVPDFKNTNNLQMVKAEEFLSAFSLLTKRELEVVKILVNGKSTKENADELHISVYTLETHKKNIFRKLEINSIGELIHIAHEYKLVP